MYLLQATLFSGILTAFLIDVRSRADDSVAVSIVNSFWFTSLILSIISAFTASVAKGWVMNIIDTSRGEIWAAAGARQRRFDEIYRLKIKDVLGIIPLIIHGSLFFFFIGLIIYLRNDVAGLRASILFLIALMAIFYGTFTFYPLFHEDFPLDTPLVVLYRIARAWYRTLVSPPEQPSLSPPEQTSVSKAHLMAEGLTWLLTTSGDSKVVFETVRAISGLPIHSDVQKVLLRQHAVARTLFHGLSTCVENKDLAAFMPYVHAIRRLVQPGVPPESPGTPPNIIEHFLAPLENFPVFEPGLYEFTLLIKARILFISGKYDSPPYKNDFDELRDTAIPILCQCSNEGTVKRLKHALEKNMRLSTTPKFRVSLVEDGLCGAFTLRRQYAQSLVSLLKHSNYSCLTWFHLFTKLLKSVFSSNLSREKASRCFIISNLMRKIPFGKKLCGSYWKIVRASNSLGSNLRH
jgi:hypothetical protein